MKNEEIDSDLEEYLHRRWVQAITGEETEFELHLQPRDSSVAPIQLELVFEQARPSGLQGDPRNLPS